MTCSKITRRDALKMTSLAALGTQAAGGALAELLTKLPMEDAQAAASNRKVRIAVVGGGFGASFHWHQDPNCEVTAVTDLRPDRRRVLSERYRCDAVYESLETMIEQAQDVDAVAIFTEAPNHERHTRMCMERGWHVISAVPACLTLEEAERLEEIKETTSQPGSYSRRENSEICFTAKWNIITPRSGIRIPHFPFTTANEPGGTDSRRCSTPRIAPDCLWESRRSD